MILLTIEVIRFIVIVIIIITIIIIIIIIIIILLAAGLVRSTPRSKGKGWGSRESFLAWPNVVQVI